MAPRLLRPRSTRSSQRLRAPARSGGRPPTGRAPVSRAPRSRRCGNAHASERDIHRREVLAMALVDAAVMAFLVAESLQRAGPTATRTYKATTGAARPAASAPSCTQRRASALPVGQHPVEEHAVGNRATEAAQPGRIAATTMRVSGRRSRGARRRLAVPGRFAGAAGRTRSRSRASRHRVRVDRFRPRSGPADVGRGEGLPRPGRVAEPPRRNARASPGRRRPARRWTTATGIRAASTGRPGPGRVPRPAPRRCPVPGVSAWRSSWPSPARPPSFSAPPAGWERRPWAAA